MNTIRMFIASSSELKDDRDQFRMFIGQQNDRLHTERIYLEIVQWENFLDAISDTRLQDEYNSAIRECDIVLCLFFTKVGKYTAEEFDTAYQVFKDKGKPKIWTYFKNAPFPIGSITEEINTLLAFKKKIGNLGHFYTEYTNIDNLMNQYRAQLDNFLLPKDRRREPIDPGINTFNEFLTKRLIAAIRPYSKKAKDFLTTNSGWETNADLSPTVKRIIVSGYVGVVGIQLRKLMSIGEEAFSESKMKRYLENCRLTAKRAIQLICFTLMSKLWDHLLNTNAKLSQTQTNILVKFFKNAAEESIAGYTDLLKTLIEIFSENNLELPIPQLKELPPNLQAGSSFMDACANLHAIIELVNKSSYTVSDCSETEKNLTVVLENLNFLAEYKMISIKDIHFSLHRNEKEGLYLHDYTLLEGDNQANYLQENVRKENSPVNSDAVLLFKENYRQNTNLVPFIIDYNALALTGGSKICFFSFCDNYDDDDHNLNYSFIEDNSKVKIKKSNSLKPDDKDIKAINKWLAIPENRKNMNFDNVFNLFNEAKRTLAGLEEESTEDTV